MPAAPQHTVAMAFVLSAVQALQGPARRQALQAAGIAPALLDNPRARVPAAAFAALWLAVAQALDDEFFGLDARRMKVGSFALLCHAVAGQATVERALRLALRGFGLFLDKVQAGLDVRPGEAALVIANTIADPQARRFADETLLVMLHGLLCWLAGRRVALRALELAHPAPAHAEEYRRMFSPVLAFDRPATRALFDPAVLSARVAVDDAGLKRFLREAPQSVILKQVDDSGLAQRLRRRLRRGADWPALDAVAAELGLSPATLRRRLAEEGCHWQQLKDELRRDLAIHHLAQGRLSVADVATRLGFAEPSAFHRAFRQWTGGAPGDYRPVGAFAQQPRADP
ncbi:DNA-binding domain-containing protein, AraC-type [Burkholderiales bacterium JOSHI_001]|nr:DNA-binding domain-containing protein, AraC-type [Burkholderiales bacterium JOSHI_001]